MGQSTATEYVYITLYSSNSIVHNALQSYYADDTCHEDCFQVTLTTAAGFDTLKCGCRPWIRRVPVRVYNLVNIIIHCVRA